jgi:hypothetical protein
MLLMRALHTHAMKTDGLLKAMHVTRPHAAKRECRRYRQFSERTIK